MRRILEAPRPRVDLAARRFESAGAGAADDAWTLTPANKSVARWLFGTCAVVGTIVVVGGITRLTESGLSIVEWKPVRGVMPPIGQAQWEEEFEKYKQFPEFHGKPDMTLREFQFIFFWEWFHRVLARGSGLVFGLPLVYFAARGTFRGQPKLLAGLFGALALGGAQGALGWYMVRSGLDPKLLDERKKATVSAYRLAAHLTLAFALFAALLRTGLGLRLPKPAIVPRGTQAVARLTTGTMFVTAISGAFVAGLDAGLLYCDTFPFMGAGWVPPIEDILPLEPAWRNVFEHGVGAQLWHRGMALTTTCLVVGLNVQARRDAGRLSPVMKRALRGVNHVLAAQVLLGFATIMSYVSIPVAALHQANSLALLAMLIRMCATMGSKGVRL